MARSTKRIGDDQLIGGLPKHMVGVSTQQSLEEFKKAKTEAGKAGGNNPTDPKGNYYWTVHPKPGACDTCKAMEGKEFMEEPERPHPNCRCEIKKHPLRRPKRYISGLLEGFAWHRFTGGAQVDIELRGISGGLTSGALIFSDHGHAKQLACMPYTTNSTSFTVDQSHQSFEKYHLRTRVPTIYKFTTLFPMRTGMITNRLFSIALFIGILCFACPAVAGEAQLSCDSIQEIAVGKGTEHLAGGSEKTVYVACVYLTPTNNPLKSILANYPGERITIQCGENLIEVPRPDISTDGSWFSIICSTPGDALAAGNSICADKVTSYLP